MTPNDLPPPVLNKTAMYERLLAGEFGNTGESWHDPDEWALSTYDDPPDRRYAIRTRTPGGPFVQPLKWDEVIPACRRLGDTIANISVVQPHDKASIQGELYWDLTSRGVPSLRYTFAKECMRDAWRIHEENAFGLKAILLLNDCLDAASYERLRELTHRYPGHVIEFSHYRIPVGVEPHRLVIWEVRRY